LLMRIQDSTEHQFAAGVQKLDNHAAKVSAHRGAAASFNRIFASEMFGFILVFVDARGKLCPLSSSPCCFRTLSHDNNKRSSSRGVAP